MFSTKAIFSLFTWGIFALVESLEQSYMEVYVVAQFFQGNNMYNAGNRCTQKPALKKSYFYLSFTDSQTGCQKLSII